jgi:hypothetical protein
LDEIPEEVKKKQDGSLKNTKILILCQDNKSCFQLNHYLTMGPSKYLIYTAFKNELAISSVAKKYKRLQAMIPKDSNTKMDDKSNVKTKDEQNEECKELDTFEDVTDDTTKPNYILTLSQVTHRDKDMHESMFEAISQVLRI